MIEGESNAGPLDPSDYNHLLDPRFKDLAAYTVQAAEQNDPEWHHYYLSRLLAAFPIRTVLSHLAQAGAKDHVAKSVVPYVRAKVAEYVEDLGTSPEDFPTLPGKSELYFALQWCGDVQTSRHLVNTALVTGLVTDVLMPEKDDLYPELRSSNVLAGATHDFGKGVLPRWVVENPVPRVLMPAVYLWDLADPLRKRPLRSPFPLSRKNQTYFADLLAGKNFDPQKIEEFTQLCQEEGREGDYLNTIPVRTLIRLAKYILKYGRLPVPIERRVESLDIRGQEAAAHMVRVIMEEQSELVRDSNWAIARSGFDGYSTVGEVLTAHEFASSQLVPMCVSGLVARHHNYTKTLERLQVSRTHSPEPDAIQVQALVMADIICALSEHRTYFVDGQPKTLSAVRRILSEEAMHRHRIPRERVRLVTNQLLQGSETRDPLRRVLENAQLVVA